MKILKSGFLAFMAAFALQSANAGDTLCLNGSPLSNSYVLLRVQFWQDPMRPTIKNFAFKSHIEIDSLFIGKIDSVLRGGISTNEEWDFSLHQKEMVKLNLKTNTSYLVFAFTGRLRDWYFLDIIEKDIFPDTPENREKLSKEWDKTTVMYANPKPKDPKEPKRMNPKDIRGLYPEDIKKRKYDPFEEIEKRKKDSLYQCRQKD
jgi:hypothetical protein